MKRLSIIIPMFKVEDYLGRCLDSCLAQDIPEDDYEIIAVDDGSPDSSAVLARRYAAEHACIRVLEQPHGGLSAARNHGLDSAGGRYVWFVDSDDWILENCLGEVLGLCEDNGLDILRFCAFNVDGETCRRRFSIPDVSVCDGPGLVDEGRLQLCAPFSVFRRDFLISNGLRFREGIYHEDAEFTPRAYYLAGKVGGLDRGLYFVRQNPDSITRSYNPQRSLDYLNVVIPSLSTFSEGVEPAFRGGFDNLISSNFSNSLKNSVGMKAEDRRKLDRCAYGARKYLRHLRRSKVFKYKVEGWVLSFFPRHMTAVYRLMKKV